MESPLDPDEDFAAYRVACPTCNLAVWAGHHPPPEQGEKLLDGHDCAGPVEAEVEPGPNGGDDDITVPLPDDTGAVQDDLQPISRDGMRSLMPAEPEPEAAATAGGPEQ